MASGAFTPYSTGEAFFGQKPAYVSNDLDAQRLQSYKLYEQLFWNAPDVLKVALRGSNSQPIYIPSARTIIDTTNRYYGAAWNVIAIPASLSPGNASAITAGQMAIADLMRRERYKSKFNGKKRYNLIWGDSIWHITADPSKPQGTRISMTSLDPSMFFPIFEDDDTESVIGCHLIQQTTNDAGDPRIQRLTYRKAASGGITVEEGLFEVDKWEDDTAAPEVIIQKLTSLPSQITALPVYHTKNTENPGDPFGSSEIRGLERIMGAINQTMSDEDLAAALLGIGMYATNASRPIDPDTGKPIDWLLGPGRVVHYDGDNWNKVPGADNIDAVYGAHYTRLWDALYSVSSTPEVAVGSIDVSVAQSGVALQIQLGPMLSKAAEKDQLLIDTETQMWHDIMQMWMPAYESTTFAGVDVQCVTGDAVPVDRVAKFAELNDMYDRGIIDSDFYRKECEKLGYSFPSGIKATADAEFKARNEAQLGTAQLNAETAGAGGTGGTGAA
jgi:hypothetical protein